jgi:hypothetical protein
MITPADAQGETEKDGPKWTDEQLGLPGVMMLRFSRGRNRRTATRHSPMGIRVNAKGQR